MTEIEIDNIVEKLIELPLSSYLVAKKTCISEQSIGNYRKRLTRPTAANAKLLEYFFMEETGSLAPITDGNNAKTVPNTDNIEANNTDNGNILALINILKNTLEEKDKQIDRLLSIIEKNDHRK